MPTTNTNRATANHSQCFSWRGCQYAILKWFHQLISSKWIPATSSIQHQMQTITTSHLSWEMGQLPPFGSILCQRNVWAVAWEINLPNCPTAFFQRFVSCRRAAWVSDNEEHLRPQGPTPFPVGCPCPGNAKCWKAKRALAPHSNTVTPVSTG